MSDSLRKTVLHGTHIGLGAKMVEFSGWEMPVQYSSIINEHKAVRERAGIFDVSHMGRYAATGSAAASFLQTVHTNDIAALKPGQAHYGFLCNTHGGVMAVPSAHAEDVWMRLMGAGAIPCGLGARDTLRLEAGMALYGHELTDETNPLEANLKRFIQTEKRDPATDSLCHFVGRDWLERSLAQGLKRKLVGLQMVERGIARAGYPVQMDGVTVGAVTSGGPSITLNQNIALAYSPVEHAKVGAELDVLIRDKATRAKVVKTPFYSRKRNAE